jgi:hypothetical protein
MVSIKKLSQEFRTSDTITKLNMIPVISTITSVALITIKALGDMKYTKCLAPHISQLKYHTYQELLTSMLPIVGTIYMIVSLAKNIIKTEERIAKQQADFLESQRRLDFERHQNLELIKNRRQVRIGKSALVNYAQALKASKVVKLNPVPIKVSPKVTFSAISALALLSLSYVMIKSFSDLQSATPNLSNHPVFYFNHTHNMCLI